MAGRAVQGEAVPVRVMFTTERVGRAQPHLFEGLVEESAQRRRFTQADQPTKGALTVRRAGVDEHPGHRAVFVRWVERVYPLPDACSGGQNLPCWQYHAPMLTSSIHHHLSPCLSVTLVHMAVADPKHAASGVHDLSLSGWAVVPLTAFNSAARYLAKQTYVHPDHTDVQEPGFATRV